MPRNRFVIPETVRLDLSEGDWVEVKSRLSYGEQQRLAGGALRTRRSLVGTGNEDFELSVDMEAYDVLRLSTWIADWSFCNSAGKQVPVSPEAIAALDPDTAAEIDEALSAHMREMQKKGGTSGRT